MNLGSGPLGGRLTVGRRTHDDLTPGSTGLIHTAMPSRAPKSSATAQRCRLECGKVRAVTTRLLKHFRKSSRDLPWRRTTDPYAIWVSEMMLQQTQIATVIPYYERWMAELPDLAAVAAAPLDQLLRLWAGLGYYARPRRFQEAARRILQQWNGRWPPDAAAWIRLPGIGRYTAGAICSIAFNQPTPVVDGNVTRVLSRLWGISTPAADSRHQNRLWELAEAHVRMAAALPSRTRRNCADFNQALMEFGALVCTPRKPRCRGCPLADNCTALQQGDPERYPQPPSPALTTIRHVRVWIFHWRERLFLQRPPNPRWNQDLWQFPTEDLDDRPARLKSSRAPLPGNPRPIFSLSHAITKHRFHVQVVLLQGTSARQQARPPGEWHTNAQILQLPLSGLHRKIHRRLTSILEDRRPASQVRKAASRKISARTSPSSS